MASVSKVYAKAIFELASETGKLDQVTSDFNQLKALFTTEKKALSALSMKSIHVDKKIEILDELCSTFNLQGMTKKFLHLLISRSRIEQIFSIIEDFNQMQLNAQGIKTGTIFSPIELTVDELQSVQASIEKRIRSKVIFDLKVDKKLLGGIVAKVDGRTFDASIRAQLEKFKSKTI